MVGCPSLDWGTGWVVAPELAGIAGAVNLLRTLRASCMWVLSATGWEEAAWMMTTVASTESTSDSRCFRCSSTASAVDSDEVEGSSFSGLGLGC